MKKKQSLGILIIITIFIAIFVAQNILQYKLYNKIVNEKISSILTNVANEYPNVSGDELLELLLKDESDLNRENILSKYGYTKDMVYIQPLKNVANKNILINIGIFSLFVITICLYILINQRKQNKKIAEIKNYITEINNKNYDLKIEENCEDELSNLKNELYKITISLKETAEISTREKEQLATSLADISHQLKTPITSIQILIDNINDNPDMDEATKNDFIKEIDRQIKWISSLIVSLLKLARFDSGSIVMNKEKIDVNKLIKNVEDNLSILLEIKNIEIETEIPRDAELYGDYKWQLEALTNIVKNAIEHSGDNSKIHILIENTSLFLKIEISDNGSGIDKEDMKHIFERFYKSKNSNENSMGIGLALSKAIIEKDGGFIRVDSVLGKGSTFEIKYIK